MSALVATYMKNRGLLLSWPVSGGQGQNCPGEDKVFVHVSPCVSMANLMFFK